MRANREVDNQLDKTNRQMISHGHNHVQGSHLHNHEYQICHDLGKWNNQCHQNYWFDD